VASVFLTPGVRVRKEELRGLAEAAVMEQPTGALICRTG